MRHPDATLPPGDKTIPPGARAYAFKSCSACLRIAGRRGLSIGLRVPQGIIEGFSHTGARPVALVITNEGDFATVGLQEFTT